MPCRWLKCGDQQPGCVDLARFSAASVWPSTRRIGKTTHKEGGDRVVGNRSRHLACSESVPEEPTAPKAGEFSEQRSRRAETCKHTPYITWPFIIKRAPHATHEPDARQGRRAAPADLPRGPAVRFDKNNQQGNSACRLCNASKNVPTLHYKGKEDSAAPTCLETAPTHTQTHTHTHRLPINV